MSKIKKAAAVKYVKGHKEEQRRVAAQKRQSYNDSGIDFSSMLRAAQAKYN